MKITYKLKRDIVARIAANLAFELSNAKAAYILKNNQCLNGKSLIGILSSKMMYGDIITIKGETEEDMKIIKEAFKDLGEVVE